MRDLQHEVRHRQPQGVARAAWVERLRQGDVEAFDELYAAFNARVFTFLVRLSRRRDVAEDLLEETWLRLVMHGRRLRADTRLGPWLFTVARNLHVSYRRSRMLEDSAATSLMALWPFSVERSSPFEAAAATELERRIERALAAMPIGSRANQIWSHRVESLFLDAFGRPDPNQDPPCERTPDTTVVQTLHLMNAPRLHAKVTSDGGRVAKLAASEKSPPQIVEELYLLAYGRRPSEEELQFGTELISENDRRKAIEDLLWALLNTPEFLFKD